MPVQFLTAEQRANYGRYVAEPTAVDLPRYFHLDDADHQLLAGKRGEHNRLGFAVQLTTVRYLGRFLDDTTKVPPTVLNMLSKQLKLANPQCLTINVRSCATSKKFANNTATEKSTRLSRDSG